MLERLSKTHRNLALIGIGAVLAWFAWTVRSVLNPLILGYLLAYILRPLVQRLQDRGLKRGPAVNIIFIVFGLGLFLLSAAVFVQARQFVDTQIVNVKEGDDLFTRAEQNIDEVLGSAGTWFDETFRSDVADEIEEGSSEDGQEVPPPEEDVQEDGAPGELAAGQAGDQAGEDAQIEEAAMDEAESSGLTLRNLLRAWTASWASGEDGELSGIDRAELVLSYLQRIFGGVMSVLGFLMLLPVYTYFLLFELERIHEFIRSHIPKRERERVTRIGRRVGAVIANFFRGRLLICLLKGLVLALGLTLLGVPYGFLLGVVSGFLSLIPFVGPMIGFGLTVVLALQKVDSSGLGIWWTFGLIGATFVLSEILEGYVFIPKILGDTLGLHPVVILLSVFVGGAALGLFGFLIAIPLAATLIILFRELVMPALADFAEEDSHVDSPTA
ncbi:MAG: AI-2E family transporter [Planctomycetota bacterium]